MYEDSTNSVNRLAEKEETKKIGIIENEILKGGVII
jgi:hypothetical protein